MESVSTSLNFFIFKSWDNGYFLAHKAAVNQGAEQIDNLHIESQGMFGSVRVRANWNYYERLNIIYDLR